MEISKPMPQEGGHYYLKDGTPFYTCLSKEGKERPTTLRDARKVGAVPSVTQILKVADKPGLNKWIVQNTLMAALTLPMLPDESLDAYSERVMADSKEQSLKAMNLGTLIHGSLEKAYEGREFPAEHKEHVAATLHAVAEQFGDQKWIAEKSFASELGYGGKLDLVSYGVASFCDDGCGVVIDFKTKDFDDPKKVEGYDEHKMQLAAYGKGLKLENFRAANVFVSTKIPGLVKIIEYSADEMIQSWEMFFHLLMFWKTKNRV